MSVEEVVRGRVTPLTSKSVLDDVFNAAKKVVESLLPFRKLRYRSQNCCSPVWLVTCGTRGGRV